MRKLLAILFLNLGISIAAKLDAETIETFFREFVFEAIKKMEIEQ